MHDESGPQNPVEAVRKAWAEDAEYRERVRTNPRRAFAEMGLDLPPAELRIAENDDEVTHVVFPPGPNAELSDGDLSAVAGGSSGWTLDTGSLRFPSGGSGGGSQLTIHEGMTYMRPPGSG